MNLLPLLFVLFFSLKGFCNLSLSCETVFERAPLNEEKYQSGELKKAMEGIHQNRDKKYPPLDRQTEKELLKVYKETGDQLEQQEQLERAFQILFMSHIGTVFKFVNFFKLNRDNFEDYLQAGIAGLIYALYSYDMKYLEKTKFNTYAYQVIFSRLKELKDVEDRLVAIKWTDQKESRKPNRKIATTLFERMNGSAESPGFVNAFAEEFVRENPQYDKWEVINFVSLLLERPSSLDMLFMDSEKETRLDRLIDDMAHSSVENAAINAQDIAIMYEWIKKRIRNRPPVYDAVVEDYVFSVSPRKMKHIAAEFRLSRHRVSQIKIEIQEMIRQRFSDFLDDSI